MADETTDSGFDMEKAGKTIGMVVIFGLFWWSMPGLVMQLLLGLHVTLKPAFVEAVVRILLLLAVTKVLATISDTIEKFYHIISDFLLGTTKKAMMGAYWLLGAVIIYGLWRDQIEQGMASDNQYLLVLAACYIAGGLYSARHKPDQKPKLAQFLVIVAMVFSLGALIWDWDAKATLEGAGGNIKQLWENKGDVDLSKAAFWKGAEIVPVPIDMVPAVDETEIDTYEVRIPADFSDWVEVPGLSELPNNHYLVATVVNDFQYKMDPEKEEWITADGLPGQIVRYANLIGGSKLKALFPCQDALPGALIVSIDDKSYLAGSAFAAKVIRGGKIKGFALNQVSSAAVDNVSRNDQLLILKVEVFSIP